jgi:integrase
LDEQVFPAGKAGESPHIVGIQRSWTKVRDRAKLGDVRLHDLRHTFASMAVDAGESLYVVQKALGHRRSSTTERYAHLRDDPVRAMVERLSDRMTKSGDHDDAQNVH